MRERERERSTNGERCQFECLDRYACVCEVIDLLQNHPPEREGERERESRREREREREREGERERERQS